MHHFIYILIVGGIAGWLAGNITKGQGFGLIWNIIIGVIGAYLGFFLFGLLGLGLNSIVADIIAATIGAVLLVFIARKLKR